MARRRERSVLCSYPGCPSILDEPGRCERHSESGWDTWKRRHGRERGSYGYGAAWRRARDPYLAAHPTCERCGKASAVEVHHRDGRSPLEHGANDWANLEAVCVPCHRVRTHELRRKRRAETA